MKIFKSLLLLFSMLTFVCLFSSTLPADEMMKFSEVKIHFTSKDQVRQLLSLGMPLDDGFYKREKTGFSIIAVLSERDMAKLQSSHSNYEILTDDVMEKFKARPKLSLAKLQAMQKTSGLQGFKFGSMAGFLTFDEVVMELDSMHIKYPNLITARDSIGHSIENRAIWAVKISDNPDIEENEPEILFTALHHAREPEGIMAVIYYMYYLLENYGTDPEVTYLVNNREIYFVPVVNPDGYVYNQMQSPNGGGMWRKNRRDNGNGTFGVDLNRNYGYNWGYDNSGSSPNPSDLTYRGTAPFSEPETQAIRDFCINHNFIITLNYHTYSNLLIYPWSYESGLLTPDSTIFIEYAREMTKYNHYTYGTGDETVGYIVNGDSDDWMYGEQEQKNKILAMTPEVGGWDDGGFWPYQSRILPLAQENLYPNLFVTWVVGGLAKVVDYNIIEVGDGNGYFDPGESGKIVFQVKNIGQGDVEKTSLKIMSTNDILTIYTPDETPPFRIAAQETVATDTFSFAISADAKKGLSAAFVVKIDNNGVALSDTLKEFIIGTPNVAFSDDIEQGTDNWLAGGTWGASTEDFHSPTHSFSDSPGGNYASNSRSDLILVKPFDLSNATAAFLQFWTKWEIESEWDFAQVLASVDSIHWQPLSGLYTSPGSGSGVQPANQPGYDGIQKNWVKETMSLNNYLGAPRVFIKFAFKSDEFVEYDGWHIDDISLCLYVNESTGVTEQKRVVHKFELQQNYPNPFNPTTQISYSLPEPAQIKLIVYNALGQQIKTLVDRFETSGRKTVQWDGKDEGGNQMASGIYFFKLTFASKKHKFGKIIKGILMK